MKNIEIVTIVNAYTEQKADGRGMKLPAKTAWTRRVNMDRLFRAKGIIDEALKEISDRYADDEHSTETDGKRVVKPEYIPQYAKEQSEILLQDTDVDIRKVTVEDLGDIELTDADMDTLAFMLDD